MLAGDADEWLQLTCNCLRAPSLALEPTMNIAGPAYDTNLQQLRATCTVAKALFTPLDDRTKMGK